MFSKTEKDEILKTLIKENKRLKYENEKLRKFLDDTKEDREKYKKLSKDIELLKRQYEDGIDELSCIREECRKKLNEVIRETTIRK